MARRFAMVVVLAAVALASAPLAGAADPPAGKNDPTADLLAKLRQPFEEMPAEVRLSTLADHLSGGPGVPTWINSTAFAAAGEQKPGELTVKPPRVKGLSVGASLRSTLAQRAATFLVRKGSIEIVPISYAAQEAKIAGIDDDGGNRLDQPLVSAIYKEKPFNEAVADLAEEYDLTIVVAPQTADNKVGFVSGRLLNVPADRAIELLAVQADLRVVRKGAAFLVTGKDHANELFGEKMDRERQKAEVARLRITPPMPQPPPAPPTPPAVAVAPAAPPPAAPAEKK